MSENRFKWCFIGTGKLANQVAGQLLKSGRHEIVSCYTRNPENGRAFAEKYDCVACSSAAEAITYDGVEGVYVVTPHNAHYRYVKQALELGKPVLCEKAFTVTAAETDELIALARKQNVYLCEAMWTGFSPAAMTAKSWIDAGRIGRVRSADFTYHMKSINYAPRVSDPKRAGGALLDITIYPITYAYRLWGIPECIETVGTVENGIDTCENIVMTYPDGPEVRISASIVDFKGLERMTITGESGTIRAAFYHAANKLVCRNSFFRREVFRLPKGSGTSYLYEFDTVAAEIRRGLKESEKVPLRCTADVMHMLDTIREQLGLVYDDLE